MNDIRIKQYVDDIFKDIKMTQTAVEQKEELIVNITERVQDYMRDGLSFDAAFDMAMNSVGNPEELTDAFENIRDKPNQPNKANKPRQPNQLDNVNSLEDIDNVLDDLDNLYDTDYVHHGDNAYDAGADDAHVKHHREGRKINTWTRWQLSALSPFIYLFFGFMFGWWAWAWVIIPAAGIIESPIPFWTKIVSLSPFIYLLMGFMFGWWAWGWMIIPVAGILTARDYAN